MVELAVQSVRYLYRLLPIALVCCMIPILAAAQNEPKKSACDAISPPSLQLTAQCQALTTFFSTCTAFSLQDIAQYTEKTDINISPLLQLSLNSGKLHVWFYGATDTICHYCIARGISDEPGIKSSTVSQAITKAQAFSAALPVFTLCNGPAKPADYEFTFIGEGRKPTENIRGCAWSISHRFSYLGTPCLGPILSVRLSAYSGRLQFLDYWPPTYPKSEPTNPISKHAAVEAAKQWQANSKSAGMLKAMFSSDAAQNTKKVIAWPNGGNNRDKEPAKVPSDESRYYWQVPFSWIEEALEGENTFSGALLVDMETSEVIGTF